MRSLDDTIQSLLLHSRKFAMCTSGNIGMIAGIGLIPFMIAVTAAVDLANAVRIKASLQAAADAGVLAAATALASGYGDSDKEKIAFDTFKANLSPQLLAAFPADPQITIDFPEQKVHMSVTANTDQLLTSLVTDSMTLNVQSTAVVDQGSPVCLMALNQNVKEALNINGTAEIQAEDCAVHVNSRHSEAMRQSGSSQATAESFCVHGDYTGTNYTPKPWRHCMKEMDPLAAKFAADLATQDLTKCRPPYEHRVQNNSNVTLSPDAGVYCQGLDVNQGTVTLTPGIHIFKDNEFHVSAQGTVIGEGVTILLVGDSNARFATQAGANLDVSAPPNGPFAGIVVAQHPDSVPVKSNDVIGGGYMRVNGIVYFPAQPLRITGNGVIGADSPQLALLADTIEVEGNGVLTIKIGADYASAGLPKLPEAHEVVRLLK